MKISFIAMYVSKCIKLTNVGAKVVLFQNISQ